MIDVGLGAEWAGADADGPVGERPKRSVNVRGTVQARADGDVEGLVEDAADLGRGQRFAAEAQRADTPGPVAMPEHLEALQFVQLPPKSLDKIHFMTAD